MENLPVSFYQYPNLAEEVMTAREYRECLKRSNGTLMTQGRVWYIKGKSLGAGMYLVSLKQKK